MSKYKSKAAVTLRAKRSRNRPMAKCVVMLRFSYCPHLRFFCSSVFLPSLSSWVLDTASISGRATDLPSKNE